MKAEMLVNCNCILGEGPLWHHKRKSIIWVDITGCCFYEHNFAKGTTRHQFKKNVSVVAETEKENIVVVGLRGEIILYDLLSEKITPLSEIEEDITGNRTNDGKIDIMGRLWIGTMDAALKPNCGSLYMMNKNFELEKRLSSLSISNGLAWSLDNSIMYFIDSPTKKVDAFSFDEVTGEIIFSKTVIEIPSHLGDPDGMCIDAEGMLWIAQWGGNGVYRWDPLKGKLLSRIDVPCPHVTSCCFGGEKYDTLFITTAREKLDDKKLKAFPLSGNLFCAKPGINGFASNYFR